MKHSLFLSGLFMVIFTSTVYAGVDLADHLKSSDESVPVTSTIDAIKKDEAGKFVDSKNDLLKRVIAIKEYPTELKPPVTPKKPSDYPLEKPGNPWRGGNVEPPIEKVDPVYPIIKLPYAVGRGPNGPIPTPDKPIEADKPSDYPLEKPGNPWRGGNVEPPVDKVDPVYPIIKLPYEPYRTPGSSITVTTEIKETKSEEQIKTPEQKPVVVAGHGSLLHRAEPSVQAIKHSRRSRR